MQRLELSALKKEIAYMKHGHILSMRRLNVVLVQNRGPSLLDFTQPKTTGTYESIQKKENNRNI
jgi:hypothetical protein